MNWNKIRLAEGIHKKERLKTIFSEDYMITVIIRIDGKVGDKLHSEFEGISTLINNLLFGSKRMQRNCWIYGIGNKGELVRTRRKEDIS